MALLSWLAANWDLEPGVLVPLALSAALYGLGWRRLRARRRGRLLEPWRGWCFAGGLAVLLLALSSPLSRFDDDFFWVHMVQHLLLIEAAAPLVLLGAPVLPMLWGLPAGARRPTGALLLGPRSPLRWPFDLLSNPVVALGLLLGAIAFWHLPPFYDAAQGDSPVHIVEHLIFLGAALLYWWGIVHPSGGRRRLGYGAALPYLLPPVVEGVILGAILTFSGEPIYRYYVEREALSHGGLTALQDQQLGGLIMWIPGGLAYLAAFFVALGRFLGQEEQRAREFDRQQAGLHPAYLPDGR